jgi:hypothetical protein
MRLALDLASIRSIQLIAFSLWLGLRVSLNSDGGIPTGRSNSLHNHHDKNTKLIKTLIYICISPYAHIPNLKLSSYGSDTTEGIWGGYASAKQNFPRKTRPAAVKDHGITTRRADAAEPSPCRRTRRGYPAVQLLTSFLTCTCGSSDPSAPDAAPLRYPHVRRRKRCTPDC